MKAKLWIVIPLALAACSGSTRWYKSDTSAADTERVAAECRRYASARAEDDYTRSNSYNYGTVGDRSLQSQMSVVGARQSEARILSDCMRSRGFRTGKPEDEKGS